MLIFHLKLWDRSAQCSSLQSFGHISNELNFSVRYGFLDFGIYLFVPAWIIQCVQHFFQCVCVCAREFFSHLSFAHRVSNGNSVKRKLLVCVKICKFTFAAFHSVSVYFFFFLTLEKKPDKQREIQKRNGMERKSQVILPRKWQYRNKEKRKRSGASKNHREEK